jgi:hypothetical protein
VEKTRAEVARHAEFVSVSEAIAEVNEKICEARPASPPGTAGEDRVPSLLGGEKRGSMRPSPGRKPPR